MNKELLDFAARLRTLIGQHKFLSGVQPLHEQFDSLALELFALQFKNNSAYRKICEARKLTPGIVEHWTQIPFVPTSAFKELELTSIPASERMAVFHSSGTTKQKQSRHFHCVESLGLYEESLLKWFFFHFDKASEFLFLTPKQVDAPHSSLVYMFEAVRKKSDCPESGFVGVNSKDGSWEINFDTTIKKLMSACNSGAPLNLLGTAFSFVHLFDFLSTNNLSFKLPKGSRVMETGGYKNRSRSMPKAELHQLISEKLGIKNVLCEYGMSELSSQAYAELDGEFQFPPWARAQIVSPETGREVADGKTGLIRIFDLANVFSAAAIQAEDLGIRRGDGFELIGRAQLAEPRGCSLMTA